MALSEECLLAKGVHLSGALRLQHEGSASALSFPREYKPGVLVVKGQKSAGVPYSEGGIRENTAHSMLQATRGTWVEVTSPCVETT